MRTESLKPLRHGGWLHRLRDNGMGWQFRPRTCSVTVPARRSAGPDFATLAEQFHKAVRPFDLVRFATDLGVCRWALMRLDIGWDGKAWTFPMRDAVGCVIGIRRRLPNGRKLCVKGSRTGLFIPRDLGDSGELLVCEGESDCAALLTLEFNAIGRPSCTGGVELVCDFARGRDIVIVADGDLPGRRGAEGLARSLRLHCRDVRVIRPPEGVKDARAWVCGGATRADVQATIDAAESVGLDIQTNAAGC